MKIQKIIIIIAISMSILFGLLRQENYAVNQINEVNHTINQTLTTNTEPSKKITANNTNTNNTSNTSATKSSNANLSNLGIKPHDFTGFKYGITSYQVEVPESTETVEVYASAQHTKATVTGTGKKQLEKGENKVGVTVTAEDGTQKTYTIYINRGTKKEEKNDVQEIQDTEEVGGLTDLKIANLGLSPDFETEQYEYVANYIGEETKLQIETTPTKENYLVEVTGNENLQEGENIITILVSDKNGNNIATYQITVNKSNIDKEAIAKEEKKQKQQDNIIKIVTVSVIVAVILILILLILKHKKKKNLAEENSEVSFYQGNSEEEGTKTNYHEEIPQALKEEKNQVRQENEEDNFDDMPKDKVKEQFLNNYTSPVELDFEEKYQETKRKGKYRGKRFK